MSFKLLEQSVLVGLIDLADLLDWMLHVILAFALLNNYLRGISEPNLKICKTLRDHLQFHCHLLWIQPSSWGSHDYAFSECSSTSCSIAWDNTCGPLRLWWALHPPQALDSHTLTQHPDSQDRLARRTRRRSRCRIRISTWCLSRCRWFVASRCGWHEWEIH